MPEVNALTLLSEDFDDLSGWNVVSGDWTVSGGVLRGYVPSGAGMIWTGDFSWAYYKVTANLRIVNSGDEANILVRYRDSSNFYSIGLGSFNHEYKIARVVDGIGEELAYSGDASNLVVGKWYLISVVAVCST